MDEQAIREKHKATRWFADFDNDFCAICEEPSGTPVLYPCPITQLLDALAAERKARLAAEVRAAALEKEVARLEHAARRFVECSGTLTSPGTAPDDERIEAKNNLLAAIAATQSPAQEGGEG